MKGRVRAARPRSQNRRIVLSPELQRITIFVLRVLAFWTAGFVTFALLPALEQGVIEVTLAHLTWVMTPIFPDLTRDGDIIRAAGGTIQIVSDCTSRTPTILLSGVIAASTASPLLKLWGCIAGAAVLWIYNLARVVILLVALARFPGSFDVVHMLFWQSLTIVVVSVVFVAWRRWALSRVAP